ncbi:MAG: hypothetical protein KDE08_06275 [Rhodobacteraceae bacterium]|nr:hypothetical protein [Paracoccaceae bacterium]
MMAGLGHNGGPVIEPGQSWRRTCWVQAREQLLPRLPIEVVRLRVKRAKEIGLDYKTYAGVRAATGHDIVAFLFSNNALRLLKDGDRVREADAEKVAAARNLGKLLAAQPPLDPQRTLSALNQQGVTMDAAIRAPGLAETWGETRAVLRAFLAENRHPADRVLLIGETALERDWVSATRMAGFLPASQYFAP